MNRFVLFGILFRYFGARYLYLGRDCDCGFDSHCFIDPDDRVDAPRKHPAR